MKTTTISKKVYRYGNDRVEYTLVKSKRRKTSEIIVDDKEITIRIPFNKSVTDAENLVRSKIRWIKNKQKEYREREPDVPELTFSNGSILPYLGHNYKLEIIESANNNDKIKFNGKFIVTLLKNDNNTNYDRRIKSLYEDWLAYRSEEIFKRKAIEFSKVLKVNPKKINIKNLKNRWGSLTENKKINLNLNLMKAPEDVIDYIIIHELCHFIIKGHSHKFWTYLHKFVPDYEEKVRWLAVNGKHLVG
jgi:predicted metal-dependent hydrolase